MRRPLPRTLRGIGLTVLISWISASRCLLCCFTTGKSFVGEFAADPTDPAMRWRDRCPEKLLFDLNQRVRECLDLRNRLIRWWHQFWWWVHGKRLAVVQKVSGPWVDRFMTDPTDRLIFDLRYCPISKSQLRDICRFALRHFLRQVVRDPPAGWRRFRVATIASVSQRNPLRVGSKRQ